MKARDRVMAGSKYTSLTRSLSLSNTTFPCDEVNSFAFFVLKPGVNRSVESETGSETGPVVTGFLLV